MSQLTATTTSPQSPPGPPLVVPPPTAIPARTRPAFEKILVGPLMIFGEMVTGGHYLEVLRLGKQMAVGHTVTPSYRALHNGFVTESGFVGAFYRGFLPWGLLQCAKGIPVLFVQHESMFQLQKKLDWSPNASERVSGFLGGTAQALFVCPLQKIKVTVVADQTMNAMGPFHATKTVITTNGISALFDGITPMVLRRSLDWGIRFAVSSEIKNRVVEYKLSRGESPQLHVHELVFCGLIGGACSALTHPIDNIITNSQKPMPYPFAKRDLVSVMKRMYQESGGKAFTRGWMIKVFDNAYHMAWMYGIGTVVYDYMDRVIREY